MGERLRIVLNWAAFVFLAYWVAINIILVPISMILDWSPPKVLALYLYNHFVWVPPMVYMVWQILQYIVWGGFKFIPWKK